MNREESSYTGESKRMAHKEVQTGSLPFLSQAPPPAWAQVVEAASNQGALNMTAQLQEITTRRHRLCFIRCTVRPHAQHYHLRIAGLLPARNKMLGPHRVIDPPCYRVATTQASQRGNSPAEGCYQGLSVTIRA